MDYRGQPPRGPRGGRPPNMGQGNNQFHRSPMQGNSFNRPPNPNRFPAFNARPQGQAPRGPPNNWGNQQFQRLPRNRPPMQGGNVGNIPQMQGGNVGNRPPMQGGNVGNRPPMQGGNVGNRPQMQSGNVGNRPLMQGGNVGNRPQMQGGNVGNRPPMQGGSGGNRPPIPGGNCGNRPPMQGGNVGSRQSGPNQFPDYIPLNNDVPKRPPISCNDCGYTHPIGSCQIDPQSNIPVPTFQNQPPLSTSQNNNERYRQGSSASYWDQTTQGPNQGRSGGALGYQDNSRGNPKGNEVIDGDFIRAMRDKVSSRDRPGFSTGTRDSGPKDYSNESGKDNGAIDGDFIKSMREKLSNCETLPKDRKTFHEDSSRGGHDRWASPRTRSDSGDKSKFRGRYESYVQSNERFRDRSESRSRDKPDSRSRDRSESRSRDKSMSRTRDRSESRYTTRDSDFEKSGSDSGVYSRGRDRTESRSRSRTFDRRDHNFENTRFSTGRYFDDYMEKIDSRPMRYRSPDRRKRSRSRSISRSRSRSKHIESDRQGQDKIPRERLMQHGPKRFELKAKEEKEKGEKRGRKSEETSPRGKKRGGTPKSPRSKESKDDESAKKTKKDRPLVPGIDYIPLTDLLCQLPKHEDAIIKVDTSDESQTWQRSSAADLYFKREMDGSMRGTTKFKQLLEKFNNELVNRTEKAMEGKEKYEPPKREIPAAHICRGNHHCEEGGFSCDSSSDDEDDEDDDDEGDNDEDDELTPWWKQELERKQNHPYRLHPDLWFNEPGELNDGPLCRCSLKSRSQGIHHGYYQAEKPFTCGENSNNKNALFHYHVTMSPSVNFLTRHPTMIEYDNHEYIFEGFSIFSHYKIERVPVCKVIRFNIEYKIFLVEDPLPESYTCEALDAVAKYLNNEILQLYDLDLHGANITEGCPRYHILPRFVRNLPDNGKEILAISEIMKYLMRSAVPLIPPERLNEIVNMSDSEWDDFYEDVRGSIVTYPGKWPSSIRVDQLDRNQGNKDVLNFPIIVHFGNKPTKLSYTGDPLYQKVWKQCFRIRHLLANKPVVTQADKEALWAKEEALHKIYQKSELKREITIEISSEGFIRTGLKSDIFQHILLLPVLINHLRFHLSLDVLEEDIGYRFHDRYLLQLALTHPSFRVYYGTNPGHARNSLSNCGRRHLEYGDREVHFINTRKRGINVLFKIMAKMGKPNQIHSDICHNERQEFLGDAVVEFLTSVHLYYMFPYLSEGGLATYRAALVQNSHLSILAKRINLQNFMLYTHASDLCVESALRHAMANAFEAVFGALYIDAGITVSDTVFANILWKNEDPALKETWVNLPKHPLQADEPMGDRHWIESSKQLQELVNFERDTGVEFEHIRLLARAFTFRIVSLNHLTMGNNQRMEFLGDSIMQLITSDFLFKHFPEHHEGHLSLLRSALVNNRNQASVCEELGMTKYILHANAAGSKDIKITMKDKADLLEAYLGALFVDKDLDYCRAFCNVVFFPRLKHFVLNQTWNDSKSCLQQCCLTLRSIGGGEPEIPIYKVLERKGPTSARIYKVAVYFRGKRLANGTGMSIHAAEMDAARNALEANIDMFPHLKYQKKYVQRVNKNWRKDVDQKFPKSDKK